MQHTAGTAEPIGLSIERLIEAPVALVFKLWTAPEHLARWLGPKDFTAHAVRMDFRPGGAWSAVIRSPDGDDYPMGGVYREITENRRLVFTFRWTAEDGPDTLVTVTFKDLAGKTRLTFAQTPFDTIQSRDSHAEGWGECLDRLVACILQERSGGEER
ncbi:SRPBCC domain-containing protein [Shinella yambaruensis]|uniref:Activator of HSP90 ATPase n=1 Tax=Shinella yambaruensis TaxID=415996 RepID=A0ABQ5ZIW9_9HYPH|nr:SRPBCC domain-containing protein [Shinella yambaruensis]MCJ8026600.1 SRPBCC domain-containing protein [Shinella yambaruensis]MCU7982394.1 SRPBCC domain-containing protein [Shinella yambaruensis]GLR51782.1 activator of HSP90 ATPase [Shinella yambaruensis]